MPSDFLELPPEQGALRVGPLPDTVTLGTDPTRCDVILAHRTGVPPVAVVLRRSPGGQWTVDFPAHPPHPCQLLADGVAPGRGRAVGPGTRLQPGETLLITGGAVHPRLTLVRSGPRGLPALPEEGAGARPGVPGAPAPTPPAPPRRWWHRVAPKPRAQALGDEARRQVGARLLARVPLLRQLRDLWWRFRGGGLPAPVVAVGTAIAIGGALCAGGVGLIGLLWALGG